MSEPFHQAPTPASEDGSMALADPTEAEGAWENGHRVGRYVILYRLGEGGMGRVYAAYDPHLDRKVALKVLRPRRGAVHARARERLLKEAQALAKLSHPNVVAIHDVGFVNEQLFLAVDLVDGQTLRRWWHAQPRRLGDLLDAFTQAGRGLAAAHAAGIVHRDFKPENALVGPDGRVQVLDFGLAEAIARDAEDVRTDEADPKNEGPNVDQLARRQGTPTYMAPEQHLGNPVGPAADQFSFCVALYEALYQSLPFEGSGPDLVRNVLHGKVREPPRDRGVPLWLRRTIRRGLSVHVSDRHPSMNALLAEIRRGTRPARRSAASMVGIVAVSLGVAWVVTATRVRPTLGVCHGPSPWAKTWDAEAHTRLRAAFDGSGRAHANETAERVERVIDDHVTEWNAIFEDVCLAAGEDAVRLEQARKAMSCLQDDRDDVSALIEELGRADPVAVDHAFEAVSGLLIPSRCDQDPSNRVTEAPWPTDITSPLARTRALTHLGHHEEAIALGRELVTKARAAGSSSLLARALFQLGESLRSASELVAAAEAFREASLEAERTDDLALLADARLATARIVGQGLHRPDEGHLWADLGAVAVARLHDSPQRTAELEATRGLIYQCEGNHAEALRQLHNALAIAHDRSLSPLEQAEWRQYEAISLAELGQPIEALESGETAERLLAENLGEEHIEVALAQATIGRVHAYAHHHEAALDEYELALDTVVRLEGPESVHGADIRSAMASSAMQLGQYERAETLLRDVLKVRVGERGDRSAEIATAHFDLGTASFLAGRPHEALGHHREALDIRERIFAPSRPTVLASLRSVADTLEALGRHGEALEKRAQALAILDERHGRESLELVDPWTDYARSLLRVHRLDEALDHAEQALHLALMLAAPAERGIAHLVLARILVERGEDSARVVELVEHGQTELAQASLDDSTEALAQELLIEISSAPAAEAKPRTTSQ